MLAGIAVLTTSLFSLSATPAMAGFANSGAGKHKEEILWFEWNKAEIAKANSGNGIVSNEEAFTVIGGYNSKVSCEYQNLSVTGDDDANNPNDPKDDVEAFGIKGWEGNGLYKLYDEENLIGLHTKTRSGKIAFKITCSLSHDKRNIPLDNLVIADAESLDSTRATIEPDTPFLDDDGKKVILEYISAKSSGSWRVIDKLDCEGNGDRDTAYAKIETGSYI